MITPVALFAYSRADCLAQTLRGLRENGIPLLYAFSDGPRGAADAPAVEQVRAVLRSIDWTEVRLVERERNLGLGVSIRTGVEEVLARHERIVVFEDDLVCAPGTYAFLCEALERYRDAPNVFSVTGFNHPRITPPRVTAPYLDGRADSLAWGTWRRAWRGMDRTALELLDEARAHGIDPRRYGSDLPQHAAIERSRNLWAARWCYLHIARRGLCLRPPVGLVQHIGVDERASNSAADTTWDLPSLGTPPAPPIPWPEPVEHPECARIWYKAMRTPSLPAQLAARVIGRMRRALRVRA